MTALEPTFLVVEDDELAARAFAQLLSETWRAECASTIAEARDACARRKFAGLVLDAALPDGTALELLAELRAQGDRTRALVVAGRFDRGLPERCHTLDADCVFKPDVARDVVVFAERHGVIAERVARRTRQVIASYQEQMGLSPRETEVLVLYLTGTPRRAIRDRIGVAENSVKTTIRRLLNKVDAADLEELAERVLEDVARAPLGTHPAER